MLKIVYAMLVAVLLVGCASGEKMIEPNAAPLTASGYVGGNFTLQRRTFAAAFIITNLASGKEYILPFTRQGDFAAGHNETSLVELPHGTYSVTHWIVFNAYWGPSVREFKAAMKPSKLTEPFKIDGNEVVFLGKFVTDNHWTTSYFTSTTSGRWEAEKISELEGKRLLTQTYPKFTSQRFVCVTCRP